MHTLLPHTITPAAFDALQADQPAWLGAITALADAHGGGPVLQAGDGTVLVALLGSDRVLKLYPPFLADHCAFEQAVLPLLHGRLAVPTPVLLATGWLGRWPYTLMGQLHGLPMDHAWAALPEPHKCSVLTSLGALASQVHALPLADPLQPLAPAWDDFIAGQRQRCRARQQRTGLPAHLLQHLDDFIAGALPTGKPVLLTGEYTPMNLLLQADPTSGLPCLAGIFDFGDGLVGPAAYDWLGPLCFLAAGQPVRVRAFTQGLGITLNTTMRQRLLPGVPPPCLPAHRRCRQWPAGRCRWD